MSDRFDILKLTDAQEATIHRLLREAHNTGGAVFCEVRRETFPTPDGALLLVGVLTPKAAKRVQKIL